MVVPQATSEVKLLARSASHDVLQQPDPSFFQEVLGTRLVSSRKWKFRLFLQLFSPY